MNTLFDVDPIFPPGFIYEENFISSSEEEQLIKEIEQLELHRMQFHQYTAERKVISFGKGWSFTDQCLKEGKPIPPSFQFLVDRIAGRLKINHTQIAQFLITEYPIGSVINWHRDAPPFETVAGISLISDCIFKLRPYQKDKQVKGATMSLTVQKRSIYIMGDESKTQWQHCTSPVKKVRYSLTFRTLKK